MASKRWEGDGVKFGERGKERHMKPHLNVGHAQWGNEADKTSLIKTDSEKQKNEREQRILYERTIHEKLHIFCIRKISDAGLKIFTAMML